MKTMIRSFASALVAVMTLGLVQTAQAEVFPIGDPVVYPEGACEVKGCPSGAEEASRVEFTLSNFAQGVQVDTVKVVPTYWGEPFEASYDYDKECYYFQMPNDYVYLEVYCSAAPEPGTDYSITYNASPEAGGKVEGGPTSATAETVIGFTVTATNEAYAIDSVTAVWGSGTVDVKGGEGGYYWFDMPEGAVTVSATFVKAITGASISGCPESAVVGDSFQLAVNVEPSGEGVETYTTTWSSSDSAVATIDENGKVSVVGPGKVEFYAFVTGQRSGAELAAGVTCTAEAKKYSITIPKFENGVVTSNVASTNEGATVTLTVTPDEGYELDTIKVDGLEPTKGEGSTYTFEMPNHDVEVAATFKEATTKYSITTVADPENTCEFEVYPVEMEAPEGDWVNFRFNLADGANFVSLTVYNTADPTQTISEEDIGTYVDENGDLWYYFTMPDYNVTIKVTTESGEAPGEGYKISTSVTPPGACEFGQLPESAQSGTDVYFELNFAAGAELLDLTVSNTSAGEKVKCEPYEKGYIFTMPDGDVLIEVVCSDPAPTTKYSIYTEVDPANACVITPSKTEAEGADIVTFTLSEFMSGQEIDYVVVRSLDGSAEFQPKYNEEMNEYWFNMPYYDVVIFVHCTSFAPDPGSGHKISTDVTPSGACEVHAQESAQFGEEVYFEVGNFAAGATLGSLTVWNMSAGEQVKCEQTGKGYIFTMPDGDVLIEVVCSDPAPTTVVQVWPIAQKNTSVGGVYTNGVEITATAEGTYPVNLNATVDVVFNADAGYFFKKDGAYTPVVTNTTTAAADPTEVFGPGPNQGTQVGDSAYAFVGGGTCTIVGSGTADTRLATVVSPGAITSVVIQPGITEIGARFFKGFKWLNAVTGGQDLATVGTNAFYTCFSLETITLDCTAVPKGMDGSVVYQTALKSDGSTYQIPEISVKNHVKMLFGKKSLDDADWTCLGPSEGKSIYEQDGYQFFQIRLVPDTGSKE